MSDKKLSFLAIAAAASIVLAVFVWHFAGTSKQTSSPQGGNLIQGLDPAAITEIVAGKGNEQIILKRQGKGFVIANKSYYPALNRAINDLLASCLDVRIVELYTEDKANHKDLGVSEENAKDIVKFLDSNGKIITGIIVGDTREDGKMAYARLVNDNKVYIIYNAPWIKSSPLDYIDTELISVDKADISWVTVTSPSETYTLISEANGTEVVFKDVPGGKKEKKSECLAVLSAITSLGFDDVNAAAEMANLKFDRQYTCLLNDSTLYTIEIARQEDSQTFVKCSAEFTDKKPVTKEQAIESQQELKKKEAKFLARQEARKFAQACEGWIYRIHEYKAKMMTRPLAELIEDIPQQQADANAPVEK